MTIPVIILTGFLGAGKTSLMRHLLQLCGETGLRPALVINEVGDVDVDGQLLADLHSEQIRLVGGCVCCTLQSQLAATMDTLVENNAGDIILIECSGMSNPLDVVSVLSMPGLIKKIAVSRVICLVDVMRAAKIFTNVELARTQATMANTLVMNKIDLLNENDLHKLADYLHILNPSAELHRAINGDPGREVLREWLTTPAPVQEVNYCTEEGCDHHHHSHALPASFCTVALPLPAPLPRAIIANILQSLPPSVIRVKGFALLADEGWQVLHRVYDSVDIYPYRNSAPTTGAILICIGQQLVIAEIKAIIDDFLAAERV